MVDGVEGGERRCLLCAAERITAWHHEDETCWVADCSVCGVPMVVWRDHDPSPPEDVRAHMVAALARVADARLGTGTYRIDEVMRRIPDHFHAHARTPGRWPFDGSSWPS